MPSFIETPRFSDDIAYGSSGGPEFKTFVWTGQSAEEQRVQNWVVARHKYNISKGVRDRDDMDTIRAWFYNVAGRATGFRFKDWRDYQTTLEVIGTGDGVETVFQVTKTYTSGAYTYVRNLKKIVAASYSIYVNAVLQTETTHYTIDTTTGIITFVSPPPNTEDVTITCEFDVPVRFDIDQLLPQEEGFLTEALSGITLIELINE